MLGALVKENDTLRFEDIRELSDTELEAFNKANERLSHFSGHTLVGALLEALNDLNELLDSLGLVSQQDMQRAEFRAKFNSKLSNWLAAFTGFRAHIEKHSADLNLPMGSSIPHNFQIVYNQHPEYRLTWQLRNVDQHDPPVGALITIQAKWDEASGKSTYRPMLDQAKLLRERIAAGDKFKHQWEGCARLWTGRPDEVDIREVFHYAYKVCESLVATCIVEPEYLLLDDIALIARTYSEASHLGSPCIYKVPQHDDAGMLNMQFQPIDPSVFGETLIAINGARKILGRPSLDILNQPL